MTKHIELTDEDMSGVASLELEKAGWVASVVDGELVFNRPGSFGCGNLCWKDAMTLQKAIDKWGDDTKDAE